MVTSNYSWPTYFHLLYVLFQHLKVNRISMNNKVEEVVKILPLWLSLTLGTLCLTLAPIGRVTNSISPTNVTSG